MMEDLLDYLGVEDIMPRGNEIQARCPRHEERTGERERRPDHWSINRTSGAHHCFSCEYSGSLTRLIMDLTKIGLWDAHQLMRRFDVELGSVEEEPWEPPITASVSRRLSEFCLPPARAMDRRHLTKEAVHRFGIRWDPEEAAWVLPIVGPTGEKWGWQTKGAEYIRNHPPGIKKGKTLFGIDVLRTTATVVLVESPLDAAYLDGLDITAVAAFGCQVSDLQMHLIIERVDEVILALDNDKAGQKEMRRLLEEGWHHRIRTSIFNYEWTTGKDPGELEPDEVRRGIKHAHFGALW